MRRSMGFGLFSTLCLTTAVLLQGCGGGGGGSGGADDDDGVTVLLAITANGASSPLWQFVAGSPVVSPNCVSAIPLNARIEFLFAGAVDPSSLPSAGIAQGSINIAATTANGEVSALGRFEVRDDASLPAGNRRRVVFIPTLPESFDVGSAVGLSPGAEHRIFLPRVGSSSQVVRVAGAGLTSEALTCFRTCQALSSACFQDEAPGAPYVMSTIPASGDPAPGAIAPGSIVGNRISLTISEPLRPDTLSIQNFQVRIVSGNALPGRVEAYLPGSPEAGPVFARLDFIASAPLPGDTEFEIFVAPEILDFGGNALQPYRLDDTSAPVSRRRVFRTAPEATCESTVWTETFDAPRTTTGLSQWSGDGRLSIDFPFNTIGNGAFGSLAFPNSGPATLDPGQAEVLVNGTIAFSRGVWNVTTFQVGAGAIVRCTGHSQGNRFSINIRVLGEVSIQGILDANAGTNAQAPVGSPEQGPRTGQLQNGQNIGPGFTNVQAVLGGVGGSGGGAGGRASQVDDVGAPVRTPRGETGLGAAFNASVNFGPAIANNFFGGGEGGVTGANNAAFGPPGELGGLGGAGGSAFQAGQNGGPFIAVGVNCNVLATTVQARALATARPDVFTTPISVASSGSGGGGGGDRIDSNNANLDDQGGGGGGGGGGIHISALGNIQLLPNSTIRCNGANGAPGANGAFAGGGGGGSGGQIWLQTFGDITIASTASLGVNGGSGGVLCGAQSGGRGSVGLIQLEDRDGVVTTNFLGAPTVPGSIVTQTFPYSTVVSETTVSEFYDSGVHFPDYVSAEVLTNLASATAPGSAVTVLFEGARERLEGGAPDLLTITQPVPLENLDQLDGYRYLRFRATLRYNAPPTTSALDIRPAIEDISIRARTARGCTN